MAFGIDDAVAAGLEIINKFVPDPAAKIQAAKELQDTITARRGGQLDLNKEETKLGAVLSGIRGLLTQWRQALGWALVFSLVYQFIFYPMLVAVILMFNEHYPVEKLPVLDWKELGSMLVGMLGLGS